MQLRLLVTSANSSLNWDLRCKVREALIDFMQRDYPQYLPLMRAELTPKNSAGQQDRLPVEAPRWSERQNITATGAW